MLTNPDAGNSRGPGAFHTRTRFAATSLDQGQGSAHRGHMNANTGLAKHGCARGAGADLANPAAKTRRLNQIAQLITSLPHNEGMGSWQTMSCRFGFVLQPGCILAGWSAMGEERVLAP